MRSIIHVWWLLAVACCQVGCTAVTTSIPSATLIIRNGTVFTGTDRKPIERGVVIIDGTRIVAVGTADTFTLPPDVPIIDAGGGTVLPGLINSHVHYTAGPSIRHKFLRAGVTTVCDLGTSLRQMPAFAQSVTRLDEPTARGLTSGPILTAVGGYPGNMCPNQWHYELPDAAAADTAVADLAAHGADMIKLALETCSPQHPVPTLTPAQVQAITEAAHARGLVVRAHVRDGRLLETAVAANVDAVEHTPLPFHLETEAAATCATDKMTLADYPALQARLDAMIANDIALVPTLAAYVYLIENELRLSPAEQTAVKALLFEEVAYFADQGGTIALGNDYGAFGTLYGLPANELHLLAEAGLSHAAILQAATQHAARVCGRGDDLGTLAPGKLADILIVHGNPLDDLDALACPAWVIQEGTAVLAFPDACS